MREEDDKPGISLIMTQSLMGEVRSGMGCLSEPH
jgi:hypothetical protein